MGIWGPEANAEQKNEDIEAMIWANRLNGGQALVHKTVSYLHDRARFESRWYRALKKLDIPCMLFWGDSDSVAPMTIPKYLATHVLPPNIMTGKILKDVGHFLMLEKPNEWSRVVSGF